MRVTDKMFWIAMILCFPIYIYATDQKFADILENTYENKPGGYCSAL
jgi:hypothetical protein